MKIWGHAKMRIDQDIIPKKTLSSGEQIPCIGLGTFGSDKYSESQIAEAVYGAIQYGYRLIDCASVYQNEDSIGQVLEKVIQEKTVTRKELFVISKVWNDMHAEGQVHISFEKSLLDLKLDYLDLYLVHWPFRNYHAPGCSGDSRNPDSKPFSVEEFMVTWRQCEELVEKGLVRYIGMSNMTIPKLEAVLPLCEINPPFSKWSCILPFNSPNYLTMQFPETSFLSDIAQLVLHPDPSGSYRRGCGGYGITCNCESCRCTGGASG